MRRVITVVLLLFVGVSLGYLVWGGTRGGDVPPAQTETAAAAAGEHVTVVYYFHGTKRCWTCRTIEAFTREAVETAYGPELETGEVEVRTVNVDEPANAHFVEDYGLSMRSVVLVELIGGEQQRWRRLDQVWNLVEDKGAFVEYIVDNADEFVRTSG